jgi:hypothetical protein
MSTKCGWQKEEGGDSSRDQRAFEVHSFCTSSSFFITTLKSSFSFSTTKNSSWEEDDFACLYIKGRNLFMLPHLLLIIVIMEG